MVLSYTFNKMFYALLQIFAVLLHGNFLVVSVFHEPMEINKTWRLEHNAREYSCN
jgi:hypothetical protein